MLKLKQNLCINTSGIDERPRKQTQRKKQDSQTK